MAATVDLAAYFGRIGYVPGAADAQPGLDTLRAIQRCHAQTIPFENLNPFVGWPVRLDIASIQQKLVGDRRGGYCFEQNLLLGHALTALDFDVAWLAARVVIDAHDRTVGPRTHMLLLVAVDGAKYIVDVGFGGLTLTAPLRLEADVEQTTPHEPCRLVTATATGEFVLEARVAGEWRALYRFGLEEQTLHEYEIANWYLSTHPQSKFVVNLVAARPGVDRRYALRNNELAVHHLAGGTDRRVLRSAGELAEALQTLFLVSLPDAPELHAALARATQIP